MPRNYPRFRESLIRPSVALIIVHPVPFDFDVLSLLIFDVGEAAFVVAVLIA